MPRRRRQYRVPGRLPVVMRMHIDPARRDEQPAGLDHPLSRTGLAADRHDALAVDCDIAGERRCAGAVDDRAARYDDVMHQQGSLYRATARTDRRTSPDWSPGPGRVPRCSALLIADIAPEAKRRFD